MTIEISFARALNFIIRYWFQITLILFAFYFLVGRSGNDRQSTSENIITNQLKGDVLKKASSAFSMGDESDGGKDALDGIDEDQTQKYIQRFKKVAQAENEKFGIPASVVLSLSLIQSKAGTNPVSIDNHNFFALSCDYGSLGSCSTVGGNQFRNYNTAWESFRDFSLFAKNNFAPLIGENYMTWAKALEKSGYGNVENLTAQMLNVVKQYRLNEMDREKNRG